MCNTKTLNFINLFLDLQPEEDDDDDDSLSSIETLEYKHAARDDEALADTDALDESAGSDEQASQEEESPVVRENEEDADETDLPDVIEIDDTSVVEILSNSSRSPPRRKRSASPKEPSGKDGDYSRIRRKAKRLKKQNKFLEAQHQEFVERERKLLDDFSKTRERLEDLEQTQEAQQEGANAIQRELEDYRLRLARLTREKNAAEGELRAMRERTSKAEADLNEIKVRCREDVRNATSQAMREVKVMADRQPILIQENHDLKELIDKKDYQIKGLKRSINALRASVQEQAGNEVVQPSKHGKKRAKDVVKALQEAKEEKERQEEQIRARKQARLAPAASRPSKNYSAQATRFSVAALKVASKKNSAMDILDSVARRKDDKSSASSKTSHAKLHPYPYRQRRESVDSDDEGAVLGGMSLNVSSAKRRKIEPRPVGKAGTTKVKKPARKGTNKLDKYFSRISSR